MKCIGASKATVVLATWQSNSSTVDPEPAGPDELCPCNVAWRR